MSAGDDDIWAQYAKGVKPLGKQEPVEKKEPPAQKKVEPVQVEATPESFDLGLPPPDQKFTPPAFAVLDRTVERNLRQGEVILEARLDLHGKTLQEAYDALGAFIAKQSGLGRRLLLVITGKGSDDGATLRSKFPRWCAEPVFAQHILAIRAAAPQHGGAGAWYVLLRKRG